MLISLNNITKRFRNQVLFQNASLQINAGEKIGLVGPNGAGKSTIFRIIVGEDGLDDGTVSMPNKTVVSYFSQEVGEMSGRSALEEAMAGVGDIAKLAHELAQLDDQLQHSATTPLDDDAMAALLERYGTLQSEFEKRGGYDLEPRAKETLTGLGIGPSDYNRPVENFSGGWKMRIAMAKILLGQPDLLLMDEPTNHLDIESIIWLEEWLRNFKGALLMTSHDREFMNRIVSQIIEVANKTITPYSGNYDFYLKERDIRRENMIAAYKRQQDMLSKEEEFIARFAARASHAAQVQSRVKKLEKIDRVELPTEERAINFDWKPAPRSGDDVVKMQGLGKTWKLEDGSERPVFSGITGTVQRLEKIAVVGVNGAGKSTLLKTIVGATPATAGAVSLGASVQVGYFSQQSLDVLNPQHTVLEEIMNRLPTATIGTAHNLLGAFLFSGDAVEKKIGVLSGGEKSRVILAGILASPVNLLVLDEPTNHLDIRSREVLLEALQQFVGTILIVSHDRYFLKHLVNKVYEIDHGEMRTYPGDYEYYLSKKTTAL